MTDHAADCQLLAQEQWSIELLARETHTEIAKVQQMFLIEYRKLALNAHITAFLPLLTCNSVRVMLDAQSVHDRGAVELQTLSDLASAR